MTTYKSIFLFLLLLLISQLSFAQEKSNVIDKVVWIVGDEPILLSEVEAYRIGMLEQRERIEGDPYCVIPEQLAVEKLYLDQAKIDSIYIPKNSLSRVAQQEENRRIAIAGSREKLEEYTGQTIAQIREQILKSVENQAIVDEVQQKLTKDVKLTPSEVRKYYSQLPQDSLPYIETTVEVQILTRQPEITLEEQDRIKGKLRDYTNRINNGEDFSTLAIMFSEDPGSAMNGGELGFNTRANYDPAFANTAFSLTDPKKVSNIVESEYGYHIIQLIEKRGERANFRHILLKPKVTYKEVEKASERLKTIGDSINAGVIPFDEAVFYLSDDKNTRNNNGLMVNQKMGTSSWITTSKFTMEELPTPIAKAVENMKVGEVSAPVSYKNPTNQKDMVALVRLKSRTPGHVANVGDDYEELRQIVEMRKKNEVLSKWVKKKIAETYVFIDPNWSDCTFKYGNWGSGTSKSGIHYAN